MKETEWLTCNDPQKLLQFQAGRASERRLRLFAVASCRRIYHHLTERGRDAIDFSERLADEPQLYDDLRFRSDPYGPYSFSSHLHAGEAVMATAPPSMRNTVATVAHRVLLHLAIFTGNTALKSSYEGDPTADAWRSDPTFRAAVLSQYSPSRRAAEACERQCQISSIRDIFGNPFRPVTQNPSWMAWNDGTVGNLAQTIYDERRFENLPILADALEEAGCTNSDILGHCREPGSHGRGCWVVDLLLGKE